MPQESERPKGLWRECWEADLGVCLSLEVELSFA
jgi:hypothetical protein